MSSAGHQQDVRYNHGDTEDTEDHGDSLRFLSFTPRR